MAIIWAALARAAILNALRMARCREHHLKTWKFTVPGSPTAGLLLVFFKFGPRQSPVLFQKFLGSDWLVPHYKHCTDYKYIELSRLLTIIAISVIVIIAIAYVCMYVCTCMYVCVCVYVQARIQVFWGGDRPPPLTAVCNFFACWFAQGPATIWIRSWNSCTKPPFWMYELPLLNSGSVPDVCMYACMHVCKMYALHSCIVWLIASCFLPNYFYRVANSTTWNTWRRISPGGSIWCSALWMALQDYFSMAAV